MIELIVSLLSPVLGAAVRFVPELFRLVTDKRDREHEYKMTMLQLQIDKARAAQQIDMVYAQGNVQNDLADASLLSEAIKAQAQQTGVGWVDALNATVRPVVTYWLLLLYATAKGVAVVMAAIASNDWLTAMKGAYTLEDHALLSSTLAFWFVDRSLRKYHGH